MPKEAIAGTEIYSIAATRMAMAVLQVRSNIAKEGEGRKPDLLFSGR